MTKLPETSDSPAYTLDELEALTSQGLRLVRKGTQRRVEEIQALQEAGQHITPDLGAIRNGDIVEVEVHSGETFQEVIWVDRGTADLAQERELLAA